MKTRQFLFMWIFLMSMTTLMGQIPVGFNYQAVARDASGTVLTNTNIEIKFTIRTGSEGGEVIWEELSNLTTDNIGSFSLVIGGTPSARTGGTASVFSDIDWSADSHFLQVMINDYELGTAQLMSVPYAALAKDVINGPESAWTTIDGNIFFEDGNVAVGSTSADSRFTIQADPNAHIDSALFEVKNMDGIPVFAVYNEGVRIYIEDTNVKGVKGGFAVGGYKKKNKGSSNEFLRVTSDSVRVWVNESSGKGVKGGFAVGGYKKDNKTTPTSFMQLNPQNYFIGHEAGLNNDQGLYNSFFGYQAGYENTHGNQNVFIGYKSGYNNLDGVLNTFIGNHTGYTNTSGYSNIFIGDSSGFRNETGKWNVFVGEGSGLNNTIGESNVFLGESAGHMNDTGNVNVFLGSFCGSKNIGGHANVFLGSHSGQNNVTGMSNIFLGTAAGWNNDDGSNNIFLGTASGGTNTSGWDNIFIGHSAGYQSQTTNSNLFIGNGSGEHNSNADGNVFLGNRSGHQNISGMRNTYVGHESALFQTEGSENTYLGAYSGRSNSIGEGNTYIGAHAAENSPLGYGNTVIGRGAGTNMTGTNNVFIGEMAGANEHGSGKLIIEISEADSSQALVYGDFFNKTLTFNSRVGIKTTTPEANLHVSSTDPWSVLMVGEPDSIAGYAYLSGAKYGASGSNITLGVSSEYDDTNDEWKISAWEEDFRIGTNNNEAYFTIANDGAIIHRTDSLYADYVFDDSYQLESIEDHAEFMWSNSHLPALPKARVDKNGLEVVDLGERNRGVLEELEKAHIYIEQLNRALKNQEALIEEMRQEIDALKPGE